MATYFYIKISNGLPIEKSQPIESEEVPEVPEGWDEVWTAQQWTDYVNSIPTPDPITPDNATTIADFVDMPIDNYLQYRNALLAIVVALGEGSEEHGFESANATEREFIALNAIGTTAQINSVLTDPSKQSIDFLMTKQAFK